MWDAAQKDRGRKAKAGLEDLPYLSYWSNLLDFMITDVTDISGAYNKVLDGEIDSRKDAQ